MNKKFAYQVGNNKKVNSSRLRHPTLPTINKQMKLVTDFAFIISSAFSCFFSVEKPFVCWYPSKESLLPQVTTSGGDLLSSLFPSFVLTLHVQWVC